MMVIGKAGLMDPAKSVTPNPLGKELMSLYPNQTRESLVIVFDLRDPDIWLEAGAVRKAWGRTHSEVYALDNDHVALVLKPGGAREAEASA